MATSTRKPPPEWLPPHRKLDAVQTGVWWDAITVESERGRALAERLTKASARPPRPIICDPCGPTPRVYFLVPRGTAARWDVPGTGALGECCYIGLPGTLDADHSGVHWLAPPAGHRPRLVRTDLLRELLDELRAAA